MNDDNGLDNKQVNQLAPEPGGSEGDTMERGDLGSAVREGGGVAARPAPDSIDGSERARFSANAFCLTQQQVAARLGVCLDECRARRVRFLIEGPDWVRSGKRVLLTEAALAALKVTLAEPLDGKNAPQMPQERLEGAGTPTASPDAQGETMSAPDEPKNAAPDLLATVYRNFPFSQKHLEATLPALEGEEKPRLIRVRVKNSRNFLRNMNIPVRLVQEPDLYECTRSAPRFPGKW